MNKEGKHPERNTTKLVNVCFLDFSNDALQKILADENTSETLKRIPNTMEAGSSVSVHDMVWMLSDLENPKLIGTGLFSREDSSVREGWTFKIPLNVLASIKDLVRDLPDQGEFVLYDGLR